MPFLYHYSSCSISTYFEKSNIQDQIKTERNKIGDLEKTHSQIVSKLQTNYKFTKKRGFKIPLIITILCFIIGLISVPFFFSAISRLLLDSMIWVFPNVVRNNILMCVISLTIGISAFIIAIKGCYRKPRRKEYKILLKDIQNNILSANDEFESKKTNINLTIDSYNKRIESCEQYLNISDDILRTHICNKFMQFESGHDLIDSIVKLEQEIGI